MSDSMSRLDRQVFAEYMAVLYFGGASDDKPFMRYVRRAYRDMNRTLHGVGRREGNETFREQSDEVLHKRLTELAGAPSLGVDDFDEWHATTCRFLMMAFGEWDDGESRMMRYGQAQKWVNMTLKYLFTAGALGVTDIGEIASCYEFAHLPIDNVILEQLSALVPPGPGIEGTWSGLAEEEYKTFVAEMRDAFVEPSMDVEFLLWRNDGKPTRRVSGR